MLERERHGEISIHQRQQITIVLLMYLMEQVVKPQTLHNILTTSDFTVSVHFLRKKNAKCYFIIVNFS